MKNQKTGNAAVINAAGMPKVIAAAGRREVKYDKCISNGMTRYTFVWFVIRFASSYFNVGVCIQRGKYWTEC